MATAVIYSTGMTKHTKAAAEYIAAKLGADVFDLGGSPQIDLSKYDALVFGTGVHAGSPYKELVSFLDANRQAFDGKRLSLFIECMYSGDRGDRQCAKLSGQLGIPDAVYFNAKAGSMNEAGLPSAVDGYIEKLKA